MRFAGAVGLGIDTSTPTHTATLTADGAAQLDDAMRALAAGWNPPYGCPQECIGGEHYFFASSTGSSWLWHPPNEPLAELGALVELCFTRP